MLVNINVTNATCFVFRDFSILRKKLTSKRGNFEASRPSEMLTDTLAGGSLQTETELGICSMSEFKSSHCLRDSPNRTVHHYS